MLHNKKKLFYKINTKLTILKNAKFKHFVSRYFYLYCQIERDLEFLTEDFPTAQRKHCIQIVLLIELTNQYSYENKFFNYYYILLNNLMIVKLFELIMFSYA